jgi:amino acid transporter
VTAGDGSDRLAVDKGLKVGAIGLLSAVVIGVASTAPGYSIAAGLGFVSQEAGDQGPAIMWVAFLPMFFIAAAYYYMNRADPDCGTTFTWATRALGPRTGWIGGWGIIVADLVIMPSLAGIAGIYTFLLFDADGLANNKWWVLLAGLIFIFLMTLVCVIGIELNARMQFFLLAAEVIVLVIFAVVAFYEIFAGDLAGSVDPQLEWLNPFAIDSTSGLVGGLVIAIFLYWGWDTAVTVNEETDNPAKTPGRAAIISTLVLIGIYVIVSIAAQGVQGADFLSANADDVLSATGNLVLGSPFDKLLIIAVLTSAAASTQTTILPAARSQLSMSAHKAAPAWFGKVSPKFLTPTNATWFFGFFSMTWYAVLTLLSEDVLGASIAAVGLMISFYYGLTGYACIVYYRKHIFTSVKNFLFVGVAPFLGATSLTYIFVKASIDLKNDTESYGSVGGLGLAFVVGIGLLLVGIPLMLAWWGVAPEFFRRGRDPHPHPAPDGTGAAVPPILDAGPILDTDLDVGKVGAIQWTDGGDSALDNEGGNDGR